MKSAYIQGYEAGLNGWPYDLSMTDNQDYNLGWAKGWDIRRRWSITNG